MSSYPNHVERHFERVLITGVSGFTGQYLVEHIRSTTKSIKLFGFDLAAKVIPDCETLSGDITCRKDIDASIKHAKPDCVIHLAGLFGSANYQDIYQANVMGTLHLLEALRTSQLPTALVVLLVCSSAAYGAVLPDELPIAEETPLRPLSHYGTSKVAQASIGLQYYLSWQIPVIRVHPFNLVGPGQSSDLLCGSLVEQFIAIERGQKPPVLSVGNLSPQRDFVDVRDAVRAYWELATRGMPGEVYNISSGTACSVQEILDILQEVSGIKIQIQQEDKRKRKVDVPIQVGNSAKLYKTTGWQPRMTLKDSLTDMLQWQRERSHSQG